MWESGTRVIRQQQYPIELLHAAIGTPEELGSNLTLWVNEHNDQWSSVDKQWGCRDNTPCHQLTAPVTTCKKMVEKHGTPVFMKIDIEGSHGVCLDSLCELPPCDRPLYISVEMSVFLPLLRVLGYDRFKWVFGTRLHFEHGGVDSSGDWGESLVDHLTNSTEWIKPEVFERLWRRPAARKARHKWGEWGDLHAKRTTNCSTPVHTCRFLQLEVIRLGASHCCVGTPQ
eukprot:TRINITY_DN2_c0_g1_i1.p1 TRINITY_DN2_c0_g1~~TRINITY_DN2_c0_g1_i1.p1  ORF type:complete len:255 (+),score=35.25 TRINITY_DN2_c0_g1_i1:84-767(+)